MTRFFCSKESKIVECKEVFEIEEKVIKIIILHIIYKAILSPYALYHGLGDMKECQVKPIYIDRDRDRSRFAWNCG